MSVSNSVVLVGGKSREATIVNALGSGDKSVLDGATVKDLQAAYIRADKIGKGADNVKRLSAAVIVRALDAAIERAPEGKRQPVADLATVARALGKILVTKDENGKEVEHVLLSSGMPTQYRYAARLYLDLDLAGNDPAAAYVLSNTPAGLAKALDKGASRESFYSYVRGLKLSDGKYREIFGEDRPKAIAATGETLTVDGVTVVVVPDSTDTDSTDEKHEEEGTGDAPDTRSNESSNGVSATGDQTNGQTLDARPHTPRIDCRGWSNTDRVEGIGALLVGFDWSNVSKLDRENLAGILADASASLAALV